jgi:two-component system, NtrC family, nitrogen regulation sensor histidine kinase NtrY
LRKNEALLKPIKTRPEYLIVNVRILILIYSLLCVLTVLFARNFFIDTLQNGEVPDRLNLIVFFTIPAVLMIVLGISIFQLFTDFLHRRPGSKFNARLLIYFAVIVVFTIAPITLMTSTALNQIVRFWHSIDSNTAIRAANSFVAENYSLHLERFENILRNNDFSNTTEQSRLPQNIASVQVFRLTDGNWTERAFTGDENFSLPSPPSVDNGFVTRVLPRDQGTIRYVQRASRNTLRVISYNLGSEFDQGKAALENQADRFETVNQLRSNMRTLLIYYYAVFFLPTLLMTAIIAISFTRRISRPIVELTEATQTVAEGDFSVQILSRRSDELGILVHSFNSMVQDLEKSRAALVRSEKISIWRNNWLMR